MANDLTSDASDPVWNAMLQAESGDRQFGPNGNPITSPAGAIGAAQVMPSTGPEAAGYAGVPYDATRLATDQPYNELLGHAEYQHDLGVFGGDPEKAAAAYNAGAGRVQQAIAEGGPQWTQHLPKETQDYIAKVIPGETASSSTGGSTSPSDSSNSTQTGQGSSSALSNPKVARALMLMSAAAPLYQFHPVTYNPFQVMPKGGSEA